VFIVLEKGGMIYGVLDMIIILVSSYSGVTIVIFFFP
jgi:hypothetical protein